MADIELVIKIDEYAYKNIREYYEKNDIVEATYSYIYHGTPLPKGHGRLIDASNLLTVTDYDGENEKTYVLYDEIDNAPTIIEADR